MLSSVIIWLRTFVRIERGQDLIEYALLSGLIAAALVGALLVFDDAITSLAQGISDCVDFDGSTVCDPLE
jgi:Flp pilus assembly pilin Flp